MEQCQFFKNFLVSRLRTDRLCQNHPIPVLPVIRRESFQGFTNAALLGVSARFGADVPAGRDSDKTISRQDMETDQPSRSPGALPVDLVKAVLARSVQTAMR